MNTVHTLFWLVILAILPAIAVAEPAGDCTCLWQGDFAEVQAQADLVVAGAIVAGKGNSVDLALEQTLRGREVQETVRV
ncbi:MAG TPA: hypothetical protein VIC02_09885, partial [Kineobactrum sp.]